MKRIKTFSALNESASDTRVFETTLGGYFTPNVGTLVEIYEEPDEIKNCSVIGGRAQWTLDLEYKGWGIRIGPLGARIVYMLLSIESEDEATGDYIDSEIEVEESQVDLEFVKTEMHDFPLSLETIEIDMKKSMNPSDWHFTLHIGNIR